MTPTPSSFRIGDTVKVSPGAKFIMRGAIPWRLVESLVAGMTGVVELIDPTDGDLYVVPTEGQASWASAEFCALVEETPEPSAPDDPPEYVTPLGCRLTLVPAYGGHATLHLRMVGDDPRQAEVMLTRDAQRWLSDALAASLAAHVHDWHLVEHGYVRTWRSTEVHEDGTVVASYGGSEDFSTEGNGVVRLECECGESRDPAGEVVYE